MLKPSDLHSLSSLGQGPGTRVWKGLDENNQPLLLKTFSLAEAPNWKAEELFAREAKVLQHLDHPCLPQLLAYGVEDQTSYLIYRFIEGESLQAKLEAGWRPALDEVIDLFRQLLKTLIWLHDRQPPLVHRDIKPSNLILTADGHLFLIDFGSVVQHLKPQGGSTVAGTFGYMAPEQLGGRALPASDLYGVGASFIHLLSGKAPAELPQARLWIQFENHVQLSAPLTHWLKSLIHPVLEERCQSARKALASLESACLSPRAPALVDASESQILAPLVSRPPPLPDSKQNPIEVKQVHQGLSIRLPERFSGQNTKDLILLNLSGMMIFFGIVYALNPHVFLSIKFNWQMAAAILPSVIGSYRLYQEIRSLKTQLILSEDQLYVNLSNHKGSYSIPWQQILHISRKKGSPGLKLVYRDAKTGKKRKLTLGETLERYEQYWLQSMLEEKSAQK